MLQHLGTLALVTLLEILNLSWRQGQVPQCWKEAIMMPILKRGKNKSKAASYRPISLTSSCCKLIESIINKRLQTYLESENILGKEQAGFRQYKSTEDQTTHLSQAVEDAFQSKKVTLAVFVDLQRAFDKVWKDGLLVKLLRFGVSGKRLQMDQLIPEQQKGKSTRRWETRTENTLKAGRTTGRSITTYTLHTLHE